MRSLLLALSVVAITGCATHQPESIEAVRARAPQASDYRICRAAMLAPYPYGQAATEEQRRRGLDCAPYAQAIIAEKNGAAQANAANTALGMEMLRQAQPPVMPMPAIAPSVICTTRPSMGGATTVCN